jgi:hypothetical protein
MANIIVRIAGKPAKCAWRTLMTTDSTRVALHLDGGTLPVGVVRTAVQFQAAHAGLDSETCGKFAQACEDVCRETLSQFTEGDSRLEVTVDTFSDRIEISIHHHGQLVPTVGLNAFSHAAGPGGGSGGLNGMELLAQVDRVMFNTEGGVARTTLVKFLPRKS